MGIKVMGCQEKAEEEMNCFPLHQLTLKNSLADGPGLAEDIHKATQHHYDE